MHCIGISTIGVMAIGTSSLLGMAGAIASSLFDRFVAAQKADLNASWERELYFRTMAEAITEIIFTADPNGMDDYFNQKCFDYTGLTLEQCRGTGWTVAVHPDDLALCMAMWENALRTGEADEIEYRLRGRDGSYRWFLCRGNPIRNSKGEVVKWFGTCTDIEGKKQNQQILEEQILERTMRLADANTRLQEEMSEKDFAAWNSISKTRE
jgi:PAS domain S-box-containing protein